MPENKGQGWQRPLSWKKGATGAEVSSLSFLVTKEFSQFLLTFVLLSSLIENSEFRKVSGRKSNEVLEHLLSFIRSFYDVVL